MLGVGQIIFQKLLLEPLLHLFIIMIIDHTNQSYIKRQPSGLGLKFIFELHRFWLLGLLLWQYLLVLHHYMTVILLKFLLPSLGHTLNKLRLDNPDYHLEGGLRAKGELQLRFHLLNQNVSIVLYLSPFWQGLAGIILPGGTFVHVDVALWLFPSINYLALLKRYAVVNNVQKL